MLCCIIFGLAATHLRFFFFQAEDGIRDTSVTGVQTCALPIYPPAGRARPHDAPPRRARSRAALPRGGGPPAGADGWRCLSNALGQHRPAARAGGDRKSVV